MSRPIIEVRGVSKRYRLGEFGARSLRDEVEQFFSRRRQSGKESEGEQANARDFWALRDVNFTIQAGEVVGIIGRNGAGKSTLLKLLSRITEPTEGEIIMRGRVASLLEVGTGFHPELSGRENIYLNGAILGMRTTEITRKFDEIVEFAEVAQFIDTPVKRYSSGMYVRLAFAVAAHLEPEILVIDEVLAVGDVQFQKKCLGKMHEVASRGRTVLFVSHNMGAISSLTITALAMEHGRVINFGPTTAVVAAYLSKSFPVSARWEAPSVSNHPLQILSLQLMDIHGRPTSEFEVSDGCQIELTVSVRSRVRNVVVDVWIYAADGQLLMVTGDYDKDPAQLEERQPGLYRIRGRLAGYLLNTGTYFVRVNSCRNGNETLDSYETVQFEVVENTTHRQWNQRLGLLSASATWKTFAVAAVEPSLPVPADGKQQEGPA